jgi:argininosuccinate lyase
LTSANASKVGGRLGERPAPELAAIADARMQAELVTDFDAMTTNNLAHLVMLSRQGIIQIHVAEVLLGALDDIAREGPANLPLDPEREDLFFNYEHAIIARVGAAVGGQLHTARSRNDLFATLMVMRFRRVLSGIVEEALATRAALLDLAARHVETVMPGYTHSQPAQPITLGHYLTAIEAGLARDWDRLASTLRRANRSPMGAAALAGTGYPIDRELVAELLGFDRVAVNTLDAVASRDYFLEALAASAIMGVTLGRFANDFYTWYTSEYGMIDFRDRIAGTSSIMPQKKNPVVLEAIRGKTVHALGAFTTAAAAVHSTPYSHTSDANREGFAAGWDALETTRTSLSLARLVLENVVVHSERMINRSATNFSTVTQLADVLVAEWAISFRQAHEVVGALVRACHERGLGVTDIDAALLRSVAAEGGLDKALKTEQIRRALDPRENVKVRSHAGGPAPAAVQSMIAAGRGQLQADTQALSDFKQRLQTGETKLASMLDELRARKST